MRWTGFKWPHEKRGEICETKGVSCGAGGHCSHFTRDAMNDLIESWSIHNFD